MLKSLIVDDEMPAREELKYILSKMENIEVVGEATHGMEALELINKFKPDIVFLDIEMPKISGIDVARKLLEKNHRPKIIFVTAYDKFAVDAFEVNAIDYLLKPISEERLKKTLRKINSIKERDEVADYGKIKEIIEEIQGNKIEYLSRISVYYKDKLIPIVTKDIFYITIEDKTTIIVTENKKYEVNWSLNELMEKLNPKDFFRSHKSYIVNLNKIESVEPWFNYTYNINLRDKKEIVPVSRSHTKEFKRIMNIE